MNARAVCGGGRARWLANLVSVAALVAALASVARATEHLPAFRAPLRAPVRPTAVTLLAERRAAPASAIAIPVVAPPPVRPDSLKIHPLLRDAIRARPGGTDTVLVSLRDPFASDTSLIHHFLSKDRSPTRVALKQLSDSLVALRAPVYQRQADTLRAYGATVLAPRYRLAQALLIAIRLDAINNLSHSREVVHIDPLHGGGPPAGGCGNSDSTPRVAAQTLGLTDPLVRPDDVSGKLALLDTGVRQSHVLLRTAGTVGPLDHFYTCSEGGCVEEGASQQDVSPDGHGTSTAAILAATDAKGSDEMGLTRARIDSYRVFDPPAGAGPAQLNWDGAPSAFDHAVLDSTHYLIVAEMADGTGNPAISTMANKAFDTGALVIAANGNHHGDGPDFIPPPANATRAIGVGMYCMLDRRFDSNNTRGPTFDGRGKPDVGGLSSIMTAAGQPDDDAMTSFPGTSCATPTVAATALLLRNWMRGTSDAIEPGLVYAMLVLSGQNISVHPDQGAGLVKIPNAGALWWGQTEIKEGDSLEIEVQQGDMACSVFDATIWWPEYGTADAGGPAQDERAWVALRLEDVRRRSLSVSDSRWSVFQKARVRTPSALAVKPWYLTVVGRKVPPVQGMEDGGPSRRRVYYALWGRP